jgi:hypothetical protein
LSAQPPFLQSLPQDDFIEIRFVSKLSLADRHETFKVCLNFTFNEIPKALGESALPGHDQLAQSQNLLAAILLTDRLCGTSMITPKLNTGSDQFGTSC